MDTCFCDFCHQPCGQRSFCDEVCYEEYEQAFRDMIAETYPDEFTTDAPVM